GRSRPVARRPRQPTPRRQAASRRDGLSRLRLRKSRTPAPGDEPALLRTHRDRGRGVCAGGRRTTPRIQALRLSAPQVSIGSSWVAVDRYARVAAPEAQLAEPKRGRCAQGYQPRVLSPTFGAIAPPRRAIRPPPFGKTARRLPVRRRRPASGWGSAQPRLPRPKPTRGGWGGCGGPA